MVSTRHVAFLLVILGAVTPLLSMEGEGPAIKVLEGAVADQRDLCVICQDHMALAPAILVHQQLHESQRNLKELHEKHEQKIQELASIGGNLEIPVPLRETAQAAIALEEESYRATLRKRTELDKHIQTLNRQALERALREIHEQLTGQIRQPIGMPSAPEALQESVQRSEQLRLIENYIRMERDSDASFEQREKAAIELMHDHIIKARIIEIFRDLMMQAVLEQNRETVLACGHRYHRHCLSDFLKSQLLVKEQPVLVCPTCRGHLSEKDLGGLSLELTTDDIFSFFAIALINHATQERIASLRTYLQALVDAPQTMTDIEQISTHSPEEVRDLIDKLQLLLKFLSRDSVRSGEFQQLVSQSWPTYTKEQLHEALFAAIDYFGITEVDIDELARWMTMQQGGALMLQLAAPYMVAFKKLLRIPHPPLKEEHGNPLIIEAQKINRHTATSCAIRLGLPPLLELINTICTTDEETPFIRLIAPYIALQALSYYFRKDDMIPYLERLMKAFFPLHVDNLPETANILAQMFFSGDIVNRIPQTLRAITAQNPQLQERTRTALLQYVEHQQDHVERVRNEISPWRVRLDRGHIVLIGVLVASILLNLYL